MADKFIKKQELQVDQAVSERVRRLINAYSAKSPGNPFGSFGDEITITQYEYSPIYQARLSSQFDTRSVERKSRPCRTPGMYRDRKYYDAAWLPVWDFELNKVSRFTDQTSSFEVKGSHHEENCVFCGGTGKVDCPRCHGRGEVKCSYCNGNGYVNERSYEKTGVRRYSDGHTEDIYEYVTYRKTCTHCNNGWVECTYCTNGKETCHQCEGYGRNVHYFSIEQELEASHARKFFHDPKIAKVAEVSDKMASLPAVTLFEKRGESLSKGVYGEEPEFASVIDQAIGEHASRVNNNSHILFQEAAVTRVDLHWVDYTYKGKRYYCAIIGDRFYDGLSPLSEYAFKLLKKANRRIGGLGTASAQRMLDSLKTLNVYGLSADVSGIQKSVTIQFDKLYSFGVSLMFWMVILFVTPFLFNFYESFNPVLQYAHFVNDPHWLPYGSIPGIQCVIFIALMLYLERIIRYRDRGKEKYLTVFGYIFSGLGLYLAAALVILLVMLGLNFLGLSILSGWIGFLIWKIIFIVLVIVFWIVALAVMLVKKIASLLAWLWHLVF